MNDNWRLWSVHLRKGFCYRPCCLRCDLIVRIGVSQSQIYFATGGLPPINSSRWQAPWDSWPSISIQLKPCGHSPYVISSLMRGWVCRLRLLLTLHPRRHSQVRVPRDSWQNFTVSDSRLPQPGGPGLRIYIAEELHRKHRFQKFLVCYVFIPWSGNTFTEL
jgi:hypothetical protein